MALLHPTLHAPNRLGAGAYRETEVLQALESGLPNDWDIFHNVDWTSVFSGRPHIGEVDIALVSPGGFLLLVEVKAGAVVEEAERLVKRYGAGGEEAKDIGAQLRRNHSAVLARLKDAGLRDIRVGTLLVLPDHRLAAPVLAHAPEGLVDAATYDELCSRVLRLSPWQSAAPGLRERLLQFLANRFDIVSDVSSRIGQVQRASAALASGLATWVPAVHHPSGLYVVQGTAGSGKTQLALRLLQRAGKVARRSAYVCFNRPLADHMARLAPVASVVTTFHELVVEHARRKKDEPDFESPGVHDALAAAFVEDAATLEPRWDLLIVDEHQDFEADWARALLQLLRPEGEAYVMGDAAQQLYPRDEFELGDAVVIRCMDNFRSPRSVVDTINLLRLTEAPVVARSAFQGSVPGFHSYPPNGEGAGEALRRCLEGLLREGVTPNQIAVLTFAGMQHSAVFQSEQLAGMRCKRFQGRYDRAGNPLWSEGELLVETLYRFKGQCAPVVVLCEVDFEQFGPKEARKLFVGLTRAQFRLECVLSERAERLLMERAAV